MNWRRQLMSMEGVTAIDEIDGDLTEEIAPDDAEVNYGILGEYTVTHYVTDSSGNVAEKRRRL